MPARRPDVVARAVSWLDIDGDDRVHLDWSEDLPPVVADPRPLERGGVTMVLSLTEDAVHARPAPVPVVP